MPTTNCRLRQLTVVRVRLLAPLPGCGFGMVANRGGSLSLAHPGYHPRTPPACKRPARRAGRRLPGWAHRPGCRSTSHASGVQEASPEGWQEISPGWSASDTRGCSFNANRTRRGARIIWTAMMAPPWCFHMFAKGVPKQLDDASKLLHPLLSRYNVGPMPNHSQTIDPTTGAQKSGDRRCAAGRFPGEAFRQRDASVSQRAIIRTRPDGTMRPKRVAGGARYVISTSTCNSRAISLRNFALVWPRQARARRKRDASSGRRAW
jgi:hypothetical protein